MNLCLGVNSYVIFFKHLYIAYDGWRRWWRRRRRRSGCGKCVVGSATTAFCALTAIGDFACRHPRIEPSERLVSGKDRASACSSTVPQYERCVNWRQRRAGASREIIMKDAGADHRLRILWTSRDCNITTPRSLSDKTCDRHVALLWSLSQCGKLQATKHFWGSLFASTAHPTYGKSPPMTLKKTPVDKERN